jgi:protein-disulfide isomerase
MAKNEPTNAKVVPDAARDHGRGPAGAKYTLVEYADYECTDCREAQAVVHELVDELEDDLWVAFRNFPLTKKHPHAQAAAEAAEAADLQGKFWLYHDRLFDHQDRLAPDDLRAYAREISLDLETFDRDLRSGGPARRVAEDVEGARKLGVLEVPTFFANGVPYRGPVEFLPLLHALEGKDADKDRFDR